MRLVTISKMTLLLLCAMLITALPLFADWKSAKDEFTKDATNNNDARRIAVTGNLVKNITSEVEPEAAGLLMEQLSSEFARNKDGKSDEKVNIKVIDACVEGLRKMTNDKAIAALLKTAANGAAEWRLRFYVVKALGGINRPDVIKELLVLVKDKENAVQMAALDGLAELGSAEAVEPACKLLTEKTIWEVKLTVLDYLRKIKSPKRVKYLKEASRNKDLEPRVLAELKDLLAQLTSELPAGDGDKSYETKSVIMGEYYGTKITSNRVIFVMDISKSMEWPAKEETAAPDKVPTGEAPKEVITGADPKKPGSDETTSQKVAPEIKNKKKEVEGRPVKKRIESVKKELIKTLLDLDSRAYFSIIFYSSDVRIWKNELVPATTENKMAAIEAVDKQIPSGRTNIYDAIEAAYKLAGSTGLKANEGKRIITGGKGSPAENISGADTIFFLTDGNPTIGKVMDSQGILDGVRKWNETRKIKINTVAIGVVDPTNPDPMAAGDSVNTGLMSEIAGMTGGVFVDKSK